MAQASSRGLLRTFAALQHRNFRLYWFGQMVSSLGTWMQSIGQAWLVLELTHNALQLGVVGALQLLPTLLFSLFAGVLVDRWPKRLVLLVTQTAAMAQAFILWALVASHHVQLWQVYLLALLLGLTTCLDMPTRLAFVVEMVGREKLPNAMALNSSLASLARIIGPALGGLIIAASSVQWLFLLNSLSFLAVLVALLLIRKEELFATTPVQQSETAVPQKTWQRLGEGLRYVWQTPAVLFGVLVVGFVLLFGSNFNVVLPLFATQVVHAGPAGFGTLSAALGAGALLAALWLAWGNRQPTILRVLVGTLVFGLLEIVFAVQQSYLLSILLMVSIGFSETAFAQRAVTLVQMTAPDHLRGRVMSVYILFFDGSVPIGYLLTGWLASSFGVARALLICALLALAVTGAGWLWWSAAEKHMIEANDV